METTAITLLILAVALGTMIFRLLPLALLSRVTLPAWLTDWLSLVPAAVLAAMLAQSLFLQGNRLVLSWHNPYLLAAAPTFVVAWRSRSVVLTMLCGIVCFALLQRLWA